MQRQQALSAQELQDSLLRIARIAGVSDAAARMDPPIITATIEYGDPNLAALFRQQGSAEVAKEAAQKLEDRVVGEPPVLSVYDLDGVGPDIAEKLEAAGIETVEDVRNASKEELVAINGIGPTSADKIKRQAELAE